ncbi:hypothetical protein [Klebsiella aerogenes]|uniref:hypothetical protein n=1 Tax=Klebsiella aerogenes TaxID=548 RepID=UPI00066858C9|nr:hypothetical protein [Klebsiella aerogenes]
MTNNQLTEAELTETLDAATSGYPLTASAEANLRRVFAELQERRKADSEPVASNYRKLFTCTGCGAEGLDEPLETNCHCCVDGAHWVESRLYRHEQPVPVVPEEMTPQQASRSYGGEVRGYRDGWNACRDAMLQDEPVTTANKLGNSPVIPDGWKLVPVEPNGDMLSAAQDAHGETDGDIASTLRAAIAAAPQEVKP